MIINRKNVLNFTVMLAVLYFYFYNHLVAAVTGKYCYPILGLIGVLSVLCYIPRMKHNFSLYELAWLFILIISTVYNKSLQNKDYLWPATFIVLCMLVISLQASNDWYDTFIKAAFFGGIVYTFATIAMYIIPQLGEVVAGIWGYYPNGTEKGEFMYRAGIADNHSANGIYCTMLILFAGSAVLSDKTKNKEKRKKNIALLCVGFIAVLLTTKRAHLLFSFASMLLVYYFFVKKAKTGKIIKIMAVATFSLFVFYVGVSYIPALQDFMEGFEGQADISNGRYEFWNAAIRMFNEKPILGNGWLFFRNSNVSSMVSGITGYVDVHNVYIQLLCESGIIGFGVCVSIFLSTIINTIRLYKRYNPKLTNIEAQMLATSVAIQMFSLMYGVTGNFFYDRSCFMYIFACATYRSVFRNVMARELDVNENKLYHTGL